jgi:hypothetical protein
MRYIAMNVKYSYNIANERAARLPFFRYSKNNECE